VKESSILNTNTDSNEADHSRWWSLWAFLIQTLTNAAVFGAIALSVVGFDWIISQMRDYGVPTIISGTLKWTNYALLIADIALFLVAQIRTIVMFLRRELASGRSHER
jgi:hypothetical protein